MLKGLKEDIRNAYQKKNNWEEWVWQASDTFPIFMSRNKAKLY